MRRLPYLLSGLVLFSLSCKDELPVLSSGESSSDPRVAPAISYTYPPVNSSGPYSEWEREWNRGMQGHFEITFNKNMVPGSVRRAIKLSSDKRDVGLDSNSIYMKGRRTYTFSVPPARNTFDVGERLTLSLTEIAYDENGNGIAPGIVCSFFPEPLFRVWRIYPPEGSTIEPRDYQWIQLHFNSKVDSTVFPFITSDPSLPGPWQFLTDSTAVFFASWLLAPSHDYRFTVAPGAPDRYGHRMVAGASHSVRGMPFETHLTHAGIDRARIGLSQLLELSFSFPPDPATIAPAFHITPSPAGGVRIVYRDFPSAASFSPVGDYEPDTRYVVRVDTSLRSLAGFPLSSELTFAFTTHRFRILSSTPRDRSSGVNRGSQIAISFSGRIDAATATGAFHISPPAEGRITTSDTSPELVFAPNAALLANTTYFVSIDTSLRSIGGHRLEDQASFSFTTGGR